MRIYYFLIILFFCKYTSCGFFVEVVSKTYSAIGDAAVASFCSFRECCSPIHIPADFDKLEQSFREYVYGQHLVENVIHALRGHWNNKFKPMKALTLSFHGWPGGGKNYVSKFIEESLYKYGAKSNFVHHFVGRIHFPEESNTKELKENLYSWLKGNITKCPKQLFIFDEVDKMPADVLNAIKPMIDYRDNIDGVDYKQAIFIFLSNTGAGLINEHYLDLWKEGRIRESLQLKDFESLISQGAFNEEGGFHHSDTIQSNLIDHYIPFLPLEEAHIKACIKDEFRKREVNFPLDVHIQEIFETVQWGPEKERLFSKTGCKRISMKVAAIVAKNYRVDKIEL